MLPQFSDIEVLFRGTLYIEYRGARCLEGASTVSQRGLGPFYIVTYIKWVKTSGYAG